MQTKKLFIVLLAVVGILVFGAAAYAVVSKRGVPFVREREQWTIGIYRGKTPFSFDSPLNRINPIFRAEDVTDISAKFVADPFLVKEDATWNLFFEVYNNGTQQGDLAVATSKNTYFWDYQKIILDEPFHLSYPYVFKWEGEYYLIPESFEANSIRLYKAVDFPTQWEFVQTLIEGRDYVDNSLVYFNDKFWLFSSVTSNDTLYLSYADSLFGPWQEHPSSPIVAGDNHKARPSGRMLVYEDQLYRYTMDVSPSSGNHQVFAYQITEITPERYAEKIVKEDPILSPSGSGWNGLGMHQLDPVQLSQSQWVASVDGFGKYLIFGWDY
jgi:hypothetical protein